MMKSAVWIMGDQIDREGSALKESGDLPIVLIEPLDVFSQMPHHWQKVVLALSAMRHFAQGLRAEGREVFYFPLAESLVETLRAFVKSSGIQTLLVMEPNDYQTKMGLPLLGSAIGCQIKFTPNTQFLTTHEQFREWAGNKRNLVMEFFYRDQRKRLGVLMEPDGSPMGGAWNLDKMNRVGAIPDKLPIPGIFKVDPDGITFEVIDDVHRRMGRHCFGGGAGIDEMRERFIWPVTSRDAVGALRHFLVNRLASFGPYEDAMTTRSWSLWHSHLSVAMNCGLLHPKAIVDETLEYALPRVASKEIPLNSLEGFMRQVIGWREFIRGIYWREMSRVDTVSYLDRNELNATRPLPLFYWSGETEMNCMRECLKPVIDFGYVHHIPRLMVLSNFAMLHGISPQAVNDWFIYAFADGYEWVTTPNVIGMSLFADGGIVGTKPYAAGGAYIDRMSDYCSGCRFDPKKATGPDACPFTRAYWPFIAKHRDRLAANPRTSLTVKGLDRFEAGEIRRRAREADAWIESQRVYQRSESGG